MVLLITWTIGQNALSASLQTTPNSEEQKNTLEGRASIQKDLNRLEHLTKFKKIKSNALYPGWDSPLHRLTGWGMTGQRVALLKKTFGS